MSVKNQLKLTYLCCLSRPAEDRAVYKAVVERRPKRIVEIGVGGGQRALRMLEAATLDGSAAGIHYTGIDLFEAQGDGPSWSLIEAYRTLRATGCTVRLLPGEMVPALARHANELPGNDLIVIAAGHDAADLSRAWFFLPRMLAAEGEVMVYETAARGGAFRALNRAEVERLASLCVTRRAA